MTRPLTAIRSAATIPTMFAALFSLLGCSETAGPATGDVSGKVTFEGKLVTEGLVSFMNSEAGTGGEAALAKDGTYTLATPLPVGDYKVVVIPLIVRQQEGGKGPEVGIEKPALDIPKKYRVIGTTDLNASVKAGKNELNFDMKR